MSAPSAMRIVTTAPGLQPLASSGWASAPDTPKLTADSSAKATPADVRLGAKRGSSDIRWGSWGESAGGEEHAEPVVVAVAEAAGEAAVQLDDPVHGLSAAVR